MLAGIAGCSSVVTVYPFAAQFDPSATSAVSAGMGLNQLVAALLSIAQNPSSAQSTRFSTAVYLSVVGGLLTLSLAAFVALWKTRIAQHLLVGHARQELVDGVTESERERIAPTAPRISLEDEQDIVASSSSSTSSSSHGSLADLVMMHQTAAVQQVVICFFQYTSKIIVVNE